VGRGLNNIYCNHQKRKKRDSVSKPPPATEGEKKGNQEEGETLRRVPGVWEGPRAALGKKRDAGSHEAFLCALPRVFVRREREGGIAPTLSVIDKGRKKKRL